MKPWRLPREDLELPAGVVLDDLVVAELFQHLRLVGGEERRLAATKGHVDGVEGGLVEAEPLAHAGRTLRVQLLMAGNLLRRRLVVEAEDVAPVEVQPLGVPAPHGLRPDGELHARQVIHRPAFVGSPQALGSVHWRVSLIG